jgi:beta-lactamase regulating signal transducer with metallopeptidase domain
MMAFVPSAMVPVAAAAFRGLAAALAVAGGLAVLRLRHVVAQKAAWTLVLAGAMLMPLTSPWLAPWLQQQSWLPAWLPSASTLVTQTQTWLKSFRTRREEQAAAPIVTPMRETSVPADAEPASVVSTPAIPAVERSSAPEELAGPLGPQYPPRAVEAYADRQPSPALTAAVDTAWALYLVIAVALLARLFYGLGAAMRLWHSAWPVTLAPTHLPVGIPVRVHGEIASPVTIGSGILLPADYAEWDEDKLRIVLAHEGSHVRQCDFYLQLAAGLYTAIFWFSPLGWWLKRKLSNLSEAISDRAAVAHAASRTSYAQILLEFASRPHTTRLETEWGVAMARKERISERIEWLLNETSFRQAFAGGRTRILAAAILAPLAVFAATALVRVEAKAQAPAAPEVSPAQAPAQGPAQQAAPTQAPATPAPQSTQAPNPAQALATGVSHPDDAPIAVPAPAAPIPTPAPDPVPAPAPAPVPQISPDVHISVGAIHPNVNVNTKVHVDADTTSYGRGYGYGYGNSQSGGDSYAVISKDGKHVRFNGDYHTGVIDKARAQAHGDFLWFTRDGKEYIVDDPEVLSRIHSIYKPMDELGEQLKAQGKQQKEEAEQNKAELDRLMAESRFNKAGLDKEMAEISARQPELQKEMAELSAQMARIQMPKITPIDQKQLEELKHQMAQLQASQPDFNAKLSELINKMVNMEMPKINAIDQEKLAELNKQMSELTSKFTSEHADLIAKGTQYKLDSDVYKRMADAMIRIGAEQGKLGGEMGRRATEADRQIKSIIDESLKNGKARPIQ